MRALCCICLWAALGLLLDCRTAAPATPQSPPVPGAAATIPETGAGRHNVSRIAGANATSGPAGNATRGAAGNAAPKTGGNATKAGWAHIDGGTRPAYVGIHGGTAPLTLLQASNGMVFAFTGQTGNDFMQVLLGSSNSSDAASRTQSDNATAQLRETADTLRNSTGGTPEAVQAAARQNATATVESPHAQESTAPPRSGNRTATEPLAGEPARTAPPVVASTPAGNDAATPASAGENALPSPGESVARMPETGPAAAAPLTEHPAPSRNATGNPATAEDPAVAALMATPPDGDSPLVFASSALAGKISDSTAGLAPFGLTEPEPPAKQPEQPRVAYIPPSAVPLPRLKLGDYQTILNGNAGSVPSRTRSR